MLCWMIRCDQWPRVRNLIHLMCRMPVQTWFQTDFRMDCINVLRHTGPLLLEKFLFGEISCIVKADSNTWLRFFYCGDNKMPSDFLNWEECVKYHKMILPCVILCQNVIPWDAMAPWVPSLTNCNVSDLFMICDKPLLPCECPLICFQWAHQLEWLIADP